MFRNDEYDVAHICVLGRILSRCYVHVMTKIKFKPSFAAVFLLQRHTSSHKQVLANSIVQ